MAKEYGVGIIGCGNISGAYFKLVPMFKNLRVVACTDINMETARSRARSTPDARGWRQVGSFSFTCWIIKL